VESRHLQTQCKNYKRMVRKKNRPHAAAGWPHSSCLVILLLEDDCGCLQTTASRKQKQAMGIFQRASRTTFLVCPVRVPETEGNPRKEIPAKACTVSELSPSLSP